MGECIARERKSSNRAARCVLCSRGLGVDLLSPKDRDPLLSSSYEKTKFCQKKPLDGPPVMRCDLVNKQVCI